jgi:hypothetical protein
MKHRLERFAEDETALVVVGADMFASQSSFGGHCRELRLVPT